MRILKNVRDGAALLDKEFGPNWVDLIDLDTLELSNSCKCILGQVHKKLHPRSQKTGYGVLRTKLGILDEESKYGFDAGWGFRNLIYTGYDRLDREWRRLIGGRRAAKLTEAA